MKKLILVLIFSLTLVASAIAQQSTVTRIAYNGNDDPEYIGIAAQNAATSAAMWKIMRITYSGSNAITIEWANGNKKQVNIWDSRAALTYR